MATLLELQAKLVASLPAKRPAPGSSWVGPLAPTRREEERRFAEHMRAEAAEVREKQRLGKEYRETNPDNSTLLPLDQYDTIAITFSGGKDSLACLLHVLERCDAEGVARDTVELWHHAVDGRPGSDPVFDWPCTESYCEAVAAALDLPLYYSWREKGILGEMQRVDATSHDITFQTPKVAWGLRGSKIPGTSRPAVREIRVEQGGKLATRRIVGPDGKLPPGVSPAWPAISGDLQKRWCSSIAKVDVGRKILTNDPRFAAANRQRPARVLVVSGERRAESTGRSYYARIEHEVGSNQSRRVDRWRPVIDWTTEEVWGLIQRWGIVPHPCYWLGFGRASCETCIFSGPEEWATIQAVHPERFNLFVKLEKWAHATIDVGKSAVVNKAGVETRPRIPGLSILERVAGHFETRGRDKVPTWFPAAESLAPAGKAGAYWRDQAMHFTTPVRVAEDHWVLPSGAFRAGAGPT